MNSPAKTVWVTGAGGLIGSHLCRSSGQWARNCSVRGLTRSELDLEDFGALRRAFKAARPDLVIHCAAVSRSPECQANPERARRLNVEVTAVLADLCAAVPFIFFSSDLVFDGREGNYDEQAAVNPLSVYGETKAAAEAIVLKNPRHAVVRTSLNGGDSPAGDRGFNEEMRRAWKAGRSLRLFTDEFRCPIPAAVTASIVWQWALRYQAGLFHLAGKEKLSRWELGWLVAGRCPELNPKIEAGSIKDYTGPPRPRDTSLNCSKIERLLGVRLPGLRDWLAANPDASF